MEWITDLLKEIPSAARYKSELEQLVSEYEILKTENVNLQEQLRLQQKDNGRLNTELQRLTHTDLLGEIEIQILTLIAQQQGNNEAIIGHLNFHPERVEYYLQELTKKKYIQYDRTEEEEEYYTLAQKGREILLKHGLI